MTDIDHHTGQPTGLPPGAPLAITHVIYALHAWSALIGITSAAFIGVILNYVYRDAAKGTYLASHFRWQVRTFWFALLWLIAGAALFITLIGIPFAWAIWVATGVWVIYRIGRGWIALLDAKPMPVAA